MHHHFATHEALFHRGAGSSQAMIVIELDVERQLANAIRVARSLIFLRTSLRCFRKNNKKEGPSDWMRDRLSSIPVLVRARKCRADIQSNTTYEN
jgi:hypothetical protein